MSFTVIFSFWGFCKRESLGKDLGGTLDHWHCRGITRCQRDSDAYFTVEEGWPWHPILCKCWRPQNQKDREEKGLTSRETVSSHNVRSRGSRMFLSIPSSFADHPFLLFYTVLFISGTYLYFLIPLISPIDLPTTLLSGNQVCFLYLRVCFVFVF